MNVKQELNSSPSDAPSAATTLGGVERRKFTPKIPQRRRPNSSNRAASPPPTPSNATATIESGPVTIKSENIGSNSQQQLNSQQRHGLTSHQQSKVTVAFTAASGRGGGGGAGRYLSADSDSSAQPSPSPSPSPLHFNEQPAAPVGYAPIRLVTPVSAQPQSDANLLKAEEAKQEIMTMDMDATVDRTAPEPAQLPATASTHVEPATKSTNIVSELVDQLFVLQLPSLLPFVVPTPAQNAVPASTNSNATTPASTPTSTPRVKTEPVDASTSQMPAAPLHNAHNMHQLPSGYIGQLVTYRSGRQALVFQNGDGNDAMSDSDAKNAAIRLWVNDGLPITTAQEVMLIDSVEKQATSLGQVYRKMVTTIDVEGIR